MQSIRNKLSKSLGGNKKGNNNNDDGTTSSNNSNNNVILNMQIGQRTTSPTNNNNNNGHTSRPQASAASSSSSMQTSSSRSMPSKQVSSSGVGPKMREVKMEDSSTNIGDSVASTASSGSVRVEGTKKSGKLAQVLLQLKLMALI